MHRAQWCGVIVILATALGQVGCVQDKPRFELKPAPAAVLKQVAEYTMQDHPEPPPFDWGEGVMMAGMMRAALVTGEWKYTNRVREWAGYWRQAGLEPLLKQRGYCGHWGPGFAVLMLYEASGDARYLAMAQEIVNFMMHRATRTSEGGLGHWRENRELWVDTLYMSCPVFALYGDVTNQQIVVEEAAHQLLVSAEHLQDKETGLFYHMYSEPKDERTPALWGRGNGWAAMAFVETLKHLDAGSPKYVPVAERFRRQCLGLIATQDEQTGMWHTVLDRPESYTETSATAMILYGLVKAEKMRVVAELPPDLVERAWAGLVTKIDARGKVHGVSAGTEPGSYEKYAEVPVGSYPWGIGAVLLAATALLE